MKFPLPWHRRRQLRAQLAFSGISRLGGLLLLSAMALAAQFSIVQPVVAQFDGGPSVATGFGFASGESIFLSFDLSGFKPEGDEDKKINLSWRCETVDSTGAVLVAPKTGQVKVDLAPEDKKWRPRIRVELALPEALPAGTAEIRLSATDLIGNTKAVLVVPFRTKGLQITNVEKLQPLNFRFLRSEDASEALSVPAYRQGDTVWARFSIAGYRLGPENSFQVGYGLEVLRANGERLFQQEEAANEKGKSAYPRRYMPGILSLQLTKDLALGEYTIVLRIRDGIGNQLSESKHLFRVE